jgi:hypothetical protein
MRMLIIIEIEESTIGIISIPSAQPKQLVALRSLRMIRIESVDPRGTCLPISFQDKHPERRSRVAGVS